MQNSVVSGMSVNFSKLPSLVQEILSSQSVRPRNKAESPTDSSLLERFRTRIAISIYRLITLIDWLTLGTRKRARLLGNSEQHLLHFTDRTTHNSGD